MPSIFGTPGNDSLTGGTGDTVFGDAGNDTITINGAGSAAYGEVGDDILIPLITDQDYRSRTVPTSLDGGSGYDTIDAALMRVDRQISASYFQWGVNAATSELELRLAQGSRLNPTSLTIVSTIQTSSIERIVLGNPDGVRSTHIFDLGALTRPIEIVGSAGWDTLSGGLAADILRGGAGLDVITVGNGDRAYGGADNDTFLLGWTTPPTLATLIDGGEGRDSLTLAVTSGRLDLVIGNAGFTIGQVAFTSIENITITPQAGAQTVNITGSDASETFYFAATSTSRESTVTFLGGGGNDVLETNVTSGAYLDGGAGDDRIVGSGILRGGSGNDRLSGSGELYGDAGDDYLTFGSLTNIALIDGGDGNDTLGLQQYSIDPTVVSLTAGTIARDGVSRTISGIENVTGADGVDQIEGDALGNILIGMGGNDTLTGLGGDDRLDGGEGDDFLYGGDGRDILIGGTGTDILEGGAAGDRLDGGAGDDRLSGGDGDDSLAGADGTDVLDGGAGDDLLDGGAGGDTLLAGAGNDRIAGGAGDDTTDGGEGDDLVIFGVNRADVVVTREGNGFTVRGAEGLDTVTNVEHFQFLDGVYDVGSNGELVAQPRAFAGTAGADRLIGTAAIDFIRGAAGDDVLHGGGGNDGLDGGDGADTTLYSGLRRQYVVDVNSVSGATEGRDALTSIENVAFVDGVLTFDAASASARVMRLYDAALNRMPDQAGLELNVAALSTMTLAQLAQVFVASAEFQQAFGALDNQAFVEQLYHSAFGREGDEAGINAWVDHLNAGMSRGDVLLGFSESAENQIQTRDTLQAGLWIPDAEAQIIARLYDATFDRLPDTAGLAGWVGFLDGGMSLQSIAGAFASSAEFQQRYGALSNQAFVEQLYRFCLDREGEPAGVAGWVGFINNGMTRAQVLLEFSESPEHAALTAANWLGGIRYQGYVGAPLEDADAGKGASDALVLPHAPDGDASHDPADLGLWAKDHDAFVLPADSDGGGARREASHGDDLMSAFASDAAAPTVESDHPFAEVVFGPIHDDLGHLLHKSELDQAWA